MGKLFIAIILGITLIGCKDDKVGDLELIRFSPEKLIATPEADTLYVQTDTKRVGRYHCAVPYGDANLDPDWIPYFNRDTRTMKDTLIAEWVKIVRIEEANKDVKFKIITEENLGIKREYFLSFGGFYVGSVLITQEAK